MKIVDKIANKIQEYFLFIYKRPHALLVLGVLYISCMA